MHLGINFFRILGTSSTFRLFPSYESKKVSGRFPDELIVHFSCSQAPRSPSAQKNQAGMFFADEADPSPPFFELSESTVKPLYRFDLRISCKRG